MNAPRISKALTLNDLSVSQLEVLTLLYERSVNAMKPQRLRRRMPGLVTFSPLSVGQVVERELWDMGLTARINANPIHDGVYYGYCISAQGFDWYEQQVATRPMPAGL